MTESGISIFLICDLWESTCWNVENDFCFSGLVLCMLTHCHSHSNLFQTKGKRKDFLCFYPLLLCKYTVRGSFVEIYRTVGVANSPVGCHSITAEEGGAMRWCNWWSALKVEHARLSSDYILTLQYLNVHLRVTPSPVMTSQNITRCMPNQWEYTLDLPLWDTPVNLNSTVITSIFVKLIMFHFGDTIGNVWIWLLRSVKGGVVLDYVILRVFFFFTCMKKHLWTDLSAEQHDYYLWHHC